MAEGPPVRAGGIRSHRGVSQVKKHTASHYRCARAAVSIPANIAEGFRCRGKADKARFVNISEGPSKNAVTS